jgi:hypothetical protein
MILFNYFVVTEVKKKTKARFFQDVKVGDVLKFSVTLSYKTGNRGIYATMIDVERQSDGAVGYFTQTELVNLLDRCFEIGEINDFI